jgi:predicted MFS family arabinose efflux permease
LQEEPFVKLGGARPAFFEKRAVGIAVLMFFLAFTYSGIISYIALCGEERGIANMSPFFLAYALGIIMARLNVGKYYDVNGPHYIIVGSFVLLILSNGVLAVSSSVLPFSLGGAVFGVSYGALQPTLLAMAVKDIEPERRGAVNGTVMGAFYIGVGAGAVILGMVASYSGYSAVYIVSAAAPLIGLLVYFAGKSTKIQRRNSP